MPLRLPTPPLFSFEEALWFLDRNLDDCMHEVSGNVVRKLLTCEGKPVLIELSSSGNAILINAVKGKITDEDAVIKYAGEWLDVDRDIAPFYRLLKKDRELTRLSVLFRGLHIVGIPDLFETLVWCIIGQQINLEFAYKVKRALVEKYGSSVGFGGKRYYLFPPPQLVAALPLEDLRALQLTMRKAEYIRGVAELFAQDLLSRKRLEALPNEEQMLNELLKIRGIGEWTANYTLMKSLRAMDRVPYGDAGINIALNRLKGIPKKNNRKEVEEVFNSFPGWKTYLVYYLWRSLRDKKV
jgi:DNA-3-methyladenine glycosylase II